MFINVRSFGCYIGLLNTVYDMYVVCRMVSFGLEDFAEKYGTLQPSQFADFVGLAGDKVDNIPGSICVRQMPAFYSKAINLILYLVVFLFFVIYMGGIQWTKKEKRWRRRRNRVMVCMHMLCGNTRNSGDLKTSWKVSCNFFYKLNINIFCVIRCET